MSALPRSGAAAVARSAPAAATGGWLTLVRPKIALMVVFSAFIGAVLGGGPAGGVGLALEAALWIGCVAASSSVFNQVLERDVDALMERTRGRPLVTGAVRLRDAVLFGAALGAAGTVGLALRFNLLAALLGLGTLAAYVLVYTPLKRVSTLNTAIGAIPGATPPLIGFAALAGTVEGWGWFLFASLFAWQFPHFLAIAWMYRDDYARAGMKMLPSLPGSEGMAGRQALLYGLFLLPVSLMPTLGDDAGLVYAAGALAAGLGYAGFAAAFALRESRPRARALLFASLVYLPVLYTAALLDPVVRLALSHTTS